MLDRYIHDHYNAYNTYYKSLRGTKTRGARSSEPETVKVRHIKLRVMPPSDLVPLPMDWLATRDEREHFLQTLFLFVRVQVSNPGR